MAAPPEIELHLDILGEPITGVWCDHCLLPAAITVEIGVFTDTGHLIGAAGNVTRCLDCEDWCVPADEEDQAGDDHAHA